MAGVLIRRSQPFTVIAYRCLPLYSYVYVVCRVCFNSTFVIIICLCICISVITYELT